MKPEMGSDLTPDMRPDMPEVSPLDGVDRTITPVSGIGQARPGIAGDRRAQFAEPVEPHRALAGTGAGSVAVWCQGALAPL